MKDLASYIRLFREISPFVGSLSQVRSGIRASLRLFASEFQLKDDATDSVSAALRENMRTAIIAIATLTEGIRSLVDYNALLAGDDDVPRHVRDALLKHRLLMQDIADDVPESLTNEYCGQMIWRVADSLMRGSLQDMCSAAMADKDKEA